MYPTYLREHLAYSPGVAGTVTSMYGFGALASIGGGWPGGSVFAAFRHEHHVPGRGSAWLPPIPRVSTICEASRTVRCLGACCQRRHVCQSRGLPCEGCDERSRGQRLWRLRHEPPYADLEAPAGESAERRAPGRS